MGSMQASEFASAVQEGTIGLRSAMSWHLTANHYPPLPGEWVAGAVEAIEAINAGEWEKTITLPKAGPFAEQSHPAADIAEKMHLWAFTENDTTLADAEYVEYSNG